VLRWMVRRRLDETRRLAHYAGKTAGVAVSGLQSIRTLKAAGLESDFFARWAGHFANLSNTQQALGLSNQCLGVLPPLLSGLMTNLILTAGGLRVMNGALSIGQLIGFHSMMTSFLMPVNSLVGLSATMQDLEADLNRLDDALDNPVDAEAAPAGPAQTPPRLSGTLEFRNVSFGYSPLAPPLIEDLSFTLEPGRRIALVGGSGSGKSTVAKLAAGLYPPASGEILFDGQPRAAIAREVLANSVAMVEQEILMFEGSVKDNLTLWDPTVPESHMLAGARDALVHSVIAAWPQGYEEELLEGAANMSGGEKQRLEIARALVNNPSLVILDEATSALDAQTEQVIDQNLRRRGCACLIVAHRLSTIRDCDQILVLRGGKVVQRGAHEELLSEGGEYARLLSADDSALLEVS
jgi:ATP-binding cassette, subfamily C, bacterial